MKTKKLFWTFVAFLLLAAVVEVAILITSKVVGWDNSLQGRPWVVSAHVHIMVLGAIFTLIMILLDKNFKITEWKHFDKFYILYLVAFSLLLSFILYKGFNQLLGTAYIRGLLEAGAAIAHLSMISSFVVFVIMLKASIFGKKDGGDKDIKSQDNINE